MGVADQAPGNPRPRTIVIGLGNPLLGDDGVGWRVADEVEKLLGAGWDPGEPGHAVEVQRLGVGGLRLMECLTGYDHAIVVDAAELPDRPLGEVRTCPLAELDDSAAGHIDSPHDASLLTALTLGRRLGASLPDRIDAVTIQVRLTDVFSEDLSTEVAAAVPVAVAAVMNLLPPLKS
jgi:hydrogenase maturation protease